MMEGELWPEHLHQAAKRGVPVVLANARLSDRSYHRYSRVRGLAQRLVLDKLSLVLAGNAQDAQRFERLGLPAYRLRFVGQLKCDVPVEPRLSPHERVALRQSLFPDMAPGGLVLLGSSTWPGEETFLLEVLQAARDECGDVRLLLVPRHAERRDEIARLLDAQDLPWQLRSRLAGGAPGTLVHVADTTGELRMLTQAADVAFIGKSLPPHREGQTPIEAAALGVPAVMGPGMGNFRDVAQSLREAHAAIHAYDRRSVKSCLLELLRNPGRRMDLAARGREWHASQRGARAATLQSIEELLEGVQVTIANTGR
jgi:3-deoxy-D-manno-octulosonic-acid transferase